MADEKYYGDCSGKTYAEARAKDNTANSRFKPSQKAVDEDPANPIRRGERAAMAADAAARVDYSKPPR
jgi:hypothetical protein